MKHSHPFDIVHRWMLGRFLTVVFASLSFGVFFYLLLNFSFWVVLLAGGAALLGGAYGLFFVLDRTDDGERSGNQKRE